MIFLPGARTQADVGEKGGGVVSMLPDRSFTLLFGLIPLFDLAPGYQYHLYGALRLHLKIFPGSAQLHFV